MVSIPIGIVGDFIVSTQLALVPPCSAPPPAEPPRVCGGGLRDLVVLDVGNTRPNLVFVDVFIGIQAPPSGVVARGLTDPYLRFALWIACRPAASTVAQNYQIFDAVFPMVPMPHQDRVTAGEQQPGGRLLGHTAIG